MWTRAIVGAAHFRSSGGFSVRKPLLVVPRADCRHASVDMSGVPGRYLNQALRVKVQALCPWREFGVSFSLQTSGEKHIASVWYWDQAALVARAAQAGRKLDEFVVACESQLRSAPSANAATLVACEQGVEAQAWQNGGLQRSLWFSDTPSDAAWQAFLRDARVTAPEAAKLPAVQRLSSHASNADASVYLPQGARKSVLMPALTALGLGAAGALAIGLGVYQWRLNEVLGIAQEQAAALKGQNQQVIELESQARAAKVKLEAIEQLQPRFAQSVLLAHLAQTDILALENGVVLSEWDYRNQKLRLSFEVLTENFVLGQFLTKLEAVKVFSNVKLLAESNYQQVVIQTEINPIAHSALVMPVVPASAPVVSSSVPRKNPGAQS